MHRPRVSPASFVPAIGLAIAVSLLALGGCSNDKKVTNSGGGGGGSTTFKGTISGNGVSGKLTLVVQSTTVEPQNVGNRASAVVTMTGLLEPDGGGASVALSGNYDNSAHTGAVSGGGWDFAGGTTGFGLEGTFTGPGPVSGVFSVQTVGSGTDTVIVVTGSFTSTTGGDNGVFNFAMRGAVVHGNAFANGSTTAIPLDGSFNVTSDSILIVHPVNPTGQKLAWGVYNTGAPHGLFDDQNGNQGNWSGNKK